VALLLNMLNTLIIWHEMMTFFSLKTLGNHWKKIIFPLFVSPTTFGSVQGFGLHLWRWCALLFVLSNNQNFATLFMPTGISYVNSIWKISRVYNKVCRILCEKLRM